MTSCGGGAGENACRGIVSNYLFTTNRIRAERIDWLPPERSICMKFTLAIFSSATFGSGDGGARAAWLGAIDGDANGKRRMLWVEQFATRYSLHATMNTLRGPKYSAASTTSLRCGGADSRRDISHWKGAQCSPHTLAERVRRADPVKTLQPSCRSSMPRQRM